MALKWPAWSTKPPRLRGASSVVRNWVAQSGNAKIELLLELIENRRLVEGASLGRVEQGQVAGHAGGSKS